MSACVRFGQIFVYYELHKFYQNYKRYVRSRDDKQMGGGKGTPSTACQPEQYIGGAPNPALPNQGAINPCGLVAWSFFNDSFSLLGLDQKIDVGIPSLTGAHAVVASKGQHCGVLADEPN